MYSVRGGDDRVPDRPPDTLSVTIVNDLGRNVTVRQCIDPGPDSPAASKRINSWRPARATAW